MINEFFDFTETNQINILLQIEAQNSIQKNKCLSNLNPETQF